MGNYEGAESEQTAKKEERCMMELIKVTRNLDGKGRLILPGDFREAAGFEPDQRVCVALADFEGEKVFIIAKRKEEPK